MTQIENLSRTEDQQYVTAIILRSIDILQQFFFLDVLEFNSTKLLNIGICSLYCVTQNNPIMYRVISS